MKWRVWWPEVKGQGHYEYDYEFPQIQHKHSLRLMNELKKVGQTFRFLRPHTWNTEAACGGWTHLIGRVDAGFVFTLHSDLAHVIYCVTDRIAVLLSGALVTLIHRHCRYTYEEHVKWSVLRFLNWCSDLYTSKASTRLKLMVYLNIYVHFALTTVAFYVLFKLHSAYIPHVVNNPSVRFKHFNIYK